VYWLPQSWRDLEGTFGVIEGRRAGRAERDATREPIISAAPSAPGEAASWAACRRCARSHPTIDSFACGSSTLRAARHYASSRLACGGS